VAVLLRVEIFELVMVQVLLAFVVQEPEPDVPPLHAPLTSTLATG